MVNLERIARDTLEIIDRGFYESPGGATVNIADDVKKSVSGTILYGPSIRLVIPPKGVNTRIEITSETTKESARRVHQETEKSIAALNFASARRPGGGFLGGATAQEEDLARSSSLYPSLLTAKHYYSVNRAAGSLYTDNIIYSPNVPFFRDNNLDLLESSYPVSVITSPAPNAYEARGRNIREDKIIEVMRARARLVLCVAAHHAHPVLVLGAWGCGVFGNDPHDVAEAFKDLLDDEFKNVFELVVFAIYDRGEQQLNLKAFQRIFGA